ETTSTMNLVDISSNNNNINHLRIISYADDLVLITKSRDETIDLLTSLCFHSNKVGLTINFNKTFIMPSPEASINNLTFEGNEIKIVNNFKYLGVLIDNKGNISGEIEARLKNAKITFMKYYKLWTAREISVKTRLRIFNATVIPVLLYGSDTWEINKSQTKKIQVFVNRCLRQLNGIFYPRIISNASLWRISKNVLIETTLKKWHIQLFGHTIRNFRQNIVHEAIIWLESHEGKTY
ncbi:unnamed protein product, partial [Gordionus sp. m RMFG-2023]